MEQTTVLLPLDESIAWLEKFDRGEGVISREVGGIGPSHEQTIQLIAAEVLRELVRYRDPERMPPLETLADGAGVKRLLEILQPTLTQVEHAIRFGYALRTYGPATLQADETIQARKIVVTKFYPSFS